MRAAVTMLQTAVGFYGEVTQAALVEVACAAPEETVEQLLSKTKTATTSDDMVQVVRDFLYDGHSGQQILERLLPLICEDKNLTDLTKARCSTLFSVVDERLTQGCDEEMQMFYLFSALR